MRFRLSVVMVMPLAIGCAGQPLPTEPSRPTLIPTRAVSIEAESGFGDGQARARSRASGGLTIHLGPGERREWVFPLAGDTTPYVVSVIYANGQEGDNELMTLSLDGVRVRSWLNRNSGDAVDGWNQFVTDSAGASTLSVGMHSVVLEISGGDGCVEIDRITLTALDAATEGEE